jgi:hypothetical protein
MRRVVLTALAAVAVVALLWTGGEVHRANCHRDGHTACSVLPWDNGKPEPNPKPKADTRPLPLDRGKLPLDGSDKIPLDGSDKLPL